MRVRITSTPTRDRAVCNQRPCSPLNDSSRPVPASTTVNDSIWLLTNTPMGNAVCRLPTSSCSTNQPASTIASNDGEYGAFSGLARNMASRQNRVINTVMDPPGRYSFRAGEK